MALRTLPATRLVPLAMLAGLTAIDVVLSLVSPEFARSAAPLTIVINWLDVVVIACLFGMSVGVTAAAVTGAADAIVLHRASLDSQVTVEVTLSIIIVQAVVAAVIGRLREMSLRIAQQTSLLSDRDRRFKALTEHATDLILVLDAFGKPTFASPSHETVLGYDPQRILDGALGDAVDEASQRRLTTAIARSTANPDLEERFELAVRHADGGMRSIEILIKNCLLDPAVAGVVLCGRDVTERKHAEETLASQARHDPLTGLPNRTHLRSRLDEELATAARTSKPLSVLFIDLDRFKDVNDALGHHWGDALLCEVAPRLRTRVRDGDVVARLGGDEFGVLLPNHGVAEAQLVADRIVKSLIAPYRIAGQTLVVGASIGIAVSTPEAESAALLRQADIAMYVAKRGRTGVAVFSSADDQEAQRRLGTATALHEAIANDRLLLHYHPQISLSTGQVVGVEALVRWDHPERGLLSPDKFIPVAEEIGMMGPLTEWVLRTSLRQLKRWRRLGHTMRMAVNLSAFNLRDSRLTNTVTRLLALYEIPASQLCLELTEGTITAEAERAVELLGRLSALGVRLSIDDFGTGYSALAHLKRYPVNELKIDRSFVSGMLDDPQDGAIVSATVDLAHRLGVDVVVEGIEDQNVWDAVVALGADLAQGMLISKPVPAEEFESWLRDYTHHQASA
ncbi:MAG: EAL domain-containing protein [Candidatus Eremiobacteraeota bacterium]|nr:EAL domain-containing protein [Candidatus Eremiobacteraeota bacterium]